MMEIRPGDTPDFLGLGGDPARLRAWLDEVFGLGEAGPGRCFTGYRDGEPRARVALVALPPDGPEVHLNLLAGDVDAAFVRAALARLERPFRYAILPDRGELAADLGWPVLMEKLRWDREAGPGAPTDLRFEAADEAAFVRAIARATAGTRDRGMEPDAAAHVAELLHLDPRLDRWALAYDGEDLVGVVVPQIFGADLGVLNLIAVVPEARGRGLAHQLVAWGLTALHAAGAARVVADCDARNPGIARALAAAGFSVSRRTVIHRGQLD